MKSKLLQVRKMLLVAAGLLVGASAWGAVEEIDFLSFVSHGANATNTLQLSSQSVEQNGTNAKTVYVVNNPVADDGTTLDLKGRIALDSNGKTGNQRRWVLRSTDGDAYKTGLTGSWNANGAEITSYNISVLNLYQGDKITITFVYKNGASPYTCSDNVISTDGTESTALTAGTALISGTKYTVLADGNLDLYSTNDNLAIQKIVIESDHISESIEAPVIKLAGVKGGDRIVSIESSKTNTGNATSTYYTLDGNDPTTASTKYTDNITITESDATDGKVTIKAITVRDGEENLKSEIGSLVLTDVGTLLRLNAPTLSLGGMAKSETYYYPIVSITSDQSSVFNPTITYTATFTPAGGSPATVAITNNAYTTTTEGTLSVVVTSNGYTPSEAAEYVVKNGYILAKTYDIANWDTDMMAAVGWDVKEDKQSATSGGNITTDGIYIAGASWTWKQGQGITQGNGSREIQVTSAEDGQLGIYYKNSNVFVAAVEAKDGKISASLDRTTNNNVIYYPKVEVYSPVPEAVSATIGATGYTTFASNYALDLSNLPEGVTAYYVSDVDGTSVVLEKATSAVEAGAGLILEGTANESYDIPVAASGNAISGNKLVGCPNGEEDVQGEGLYVLVNNGGTAEFQQLNVNAANIPAGKAYLNMAEAAGARLGIVIAGETTGIAEVATADAEDGAVYNLSGQRVSKPANGLYIVNGKKVIIK